MDEKLKQLLQEYVATANNPDYNSDWGLINSKFPEFKDYDPKLLEAYVATANNPQYESNWDTINSKFPEFTSPKQNEVSGTGSKNTSGTSTEPSKTSQKPNWIQESGDVIQDTKGTTKFDLGLNRVEVENLQFEEPLIDEKTGRPLEVTYQAELTPEQDTGERSYLQNLENSLNNNLNQLKGFDERIVVTAGALSKKLLPIVGSSAEELYQYAGLDFNAVMDTAINELDRLAGETLETANFTDADNAKDFFSALTDSVLAVVNSGLVASTTYGVGLATDMIGGSISEANKTKADRLGISVKELYKTNQEDFYAPAILGGAGYLLERYGYKGVKQAINRKISSGLGRYLTTVAIDNNKEGFTEWLQYGGDSVNTFLAEGGRLEDAGEIFADALFSKQGLEMYLKGMAGSTAISAPSVIVNSLANSKTREKAYKLDTERRKLIQELQNDFISQNPITRDAVLTKIESISEELDALYNQDLSGNKGNLTLEQTEEVNNLSSQIVEIEQAVENPEISEEVKTALNEEKNTLQTKIDEVISNSNKQVEAKAGSRLFSTPVEGLSEISTSYKQEKGITEPEGQPIRKLDEQRSMRIADAYEAMEHAPNDPKVKKAYEAMATETVDQFDAITNAGYSVEIYEGEGEPYANSQEMLADLRDNKHLYVLPTEKEFGQTPITDTQRAENPLLRDSGKKDINGKPLLVNDVFRFVHDVFGHGERGNSFGAIGEENAWDVHARMYSPEARRAMTTETRGQNSWVNFGNHLRNEEGVVPKKGQEGFVPVTERPFAEQKIGLLPEEFSQLEETQVVGNPDQATDSVQQNITTQSEQVNNKGKVPTQMNNEEIESELDFLETRLTEGDNRTRFNQLEKELEQREWDSINNVPIDEAKQYLQSISKKDVNVFAEPRDIRESLQVIEEYDNANKKGDAEVISDFREAILGNPDTWNADSLRLKLAVQEAINRGISQETLIDSVVSEFVRDGFSEQDGREVVALRIKRVSGRNARTSKNQPLSQETQQSQNSVQQNETFTEPEQSEIVNTEQTNTASPDLEIEGEVKTPTSSKLKEIEARREKIRERIRKRGGTLSAGINPEDMVDYVALGATYVEEGIVKFSEFVSNLKSDLPEKQFKKLNDKNLREIYTKSAEAQGYKLRKFPERVRTSKKVSDETKAIVQDSPETIAYEPQVLATATERVEALPELEKLSKIATLSKATTSLSDSDNDAILAGISLINKYESEGRHEESAKIIQQMAKSATVMGQALRQYGEFKNSTPAGYMSLVEEALKEKGKELNATNRAKIEAMYKELQGAVEAYQQAVALAGKDTSKKAWADRKKAQIALEDANRKLSDYVAKVYGKSWGRVMSTILQGSLLTPKSLIINPFSNIVQGAIRAGINTNAFIFDTIISNIWGLPKSKIGINATSLRLGARAVKEGTQTATRKAVRGDASLETNKFEMSTRLKPWESAKDLWYSMTEKEFREEFNQDFEDQFSNAIEATIGVVPNLMFRMLPFGDDPFFASVRTLRLVEIGKTNKGLKGKELEQFVNNPDEDSDMIATSYAKEATFQDPTKLAKAIQSIMRTVEDLVGNSQLGKSKFIKGLTQVMLKQAVPFVNTPSSIIWKTVSFSVPPIPFLMAVNQFIKLYNIKGWESSPKKREEVINAKRKLVEYLGEATLASSLLYVSSLLVSMGLATGDLPDEPERAKEKNFMYNTQPANTLNISGLRRLLAGEDSTWQQGDYVVSYIPLGVLGAQIGITEATLGKQLREAVKKSKTISPDGTPQETLSKANIAQQVTGNWLGNLPAALTYVIGQPFVQSTEVMLSSLSKGDTGQWGIQMVRTLSNLGVPNAVSQAFRASNEYMRDIYTENDLETFGNIIKEKTANVEDLPMRYNMWGEPVKQSPEGTNPYVFQMLDIFRTQKILEDEVTYKVFDIYRKTKENSVIPNTVKDYYKDKDFTVKLTKQQKADLSRIVGEERRKRVEKVLRNYTKDSDPEKFVKQLRDAYSKGASQGKRILLKQMKEQGIDVKANIRAFRESVEDED